MFILKLKNFFRFTISIILIFTPKSKKKYIYCNLIGNSLTGGPDRFLKNLKNSKNIKNVVDLENWNLKKCSSALVFSNSWGNSFTFLCKIFNVRSVLRVDGFYVPDDVNVKEYQQDKKYRDFVNNRLKIDLQKFDHIIYQSYFSKKICDQALYKRENNYSIINNGVNISHFYPIVKKKTKYLKLVILGKHYPKHIDLAINVFEKIQKKIDTELTIIGPMRNGSSVVDFLKTMKINPSTYKHIKLKGTIKYEDLPKVLNKYDIFLHVKVGDWCPNAVLEALSCGLPVVCPDWGGTKELIGEAGICVKGSEWDVDLNLINGMADAVIEIYYNLNSFQLKARKRIEKKFNMEKITLQYIKILGLNDN